MSTKGEQTRADIIAAASELFYRRGYAQTSFSHIVDQTGISRGNINHYFRTKDEILDAVVATRVGEYKTLLESWDSLYPDPKKRLHCFVQMVAANKDNLTRYGCPIGTLNTELGKASCDFRHAARRLFDTCLDWLTLQFSKLGRPEQARTRALHLLARTEGISVVAHVYNDADLVTTEIKTLQKWIDGL